MSSATFQIPTTLFDEDTDDPDDRDELAERLCRLVKRAFGHAGVDCGVEIDEDAPEEGAWAGDPSGLDRGAAEELFGDVLELFRDNEGVERATAESLFANDLVADVEDS